MESFKHKGKRRQLVALLEKKGIDDQRVLDAINVVPRHLFINSIFEHHAYEDKAFPIAADQTISHPYTVAFQSSLLDLHPGEKVLEIGTGSGYQTAVLVAMGAEVYTIERQKNLVDFSRNILKKINLEPKYQTFGDGFKGLPSFAPFDKIIVTAGAPSLPTLLVQQLKVGGIAVIPIGEENQKMYTYLRIDERKYEQMEFGDYKFVPMLEKRDDI
ncbi:MAG: protein-L-isoaspartate(D-aspartate) O-methyltransferase [Weeksellaceae bacterium]